MPSTPCPSRWSEDEINQTVAALVRKFPEEAEERLHHVVQFCRGAVFPGDGRDQLLAFAAELVRRMPTRKTKGGVPPHPRRSEAENLSASRGA